MTRLLIIAFLSFLISCGATTADTTTAKNYKSDSANKGNVNNDTHTWEYNSEVDKMSDKTSFGATLEANEPLELKFPYEGSRAYLRLIFNNKNMLVLGVSKGQFMASSVSDEEIKVRFDNNKPEIYKCPGSSDGDSRYLFIGSSKTLIDKLKRSKKVLIEAEMFENGFQEMEFNTEGLIWNH